MVHLLFGPEVRQMLADNNVAEMKEFCESLHPATVAEALAGEFSVDEVWRFLKSTSIKNQAAIFEYFPIDWQVKMVEGTGREHMATLIKEMSHDDRVDLLRRLMPRVTESLLRLVDEANRKDIAMLVSQQPNTAGGLMTTDYAWLPPNLMAREAIERLRLQAPETETIYYVYVLDEQHRLMGVVSLRDLILAHPQTRIRDIMEDTVVSIRASLDREQVAKEMARYDLLAMPVVDDQGRMVGIVTHDDIMDVVVKEATEDVHRLGAVGLIEESYLEANFVTIWRKRVGWLSLLFVAGSFTILALRGFQDSMERVPVLSLFIALCIGTGGNSGSQAATLITRSLALGELTAKSWLQVFWHELVMGLALGMSLGVMGFLICGLLSPLILVESPIAWWQLALVVSQAVAMICLWGTLVGSLLPLAFRGMGFDPAFASSPFVSIFVDVTGILIYFSIAHWTLGIL